MSMSELPLSGPICLHCLYIDGQVTRRLCGQSYRPWIYTTRHFSKNTNLTRVFNTVLSPTSKFDRDKTENTHVYQKRKSMSLPQIKSNPIYRPNLHATCAHFFFRPVPAVGFPGLDTRPYNLDCFLWALVDSDFTATDTPF